MSFGPEQERPSVEVTEKEAAELSLTKNRGLEEYEKELPFTDRDISGKDVLDLGSGQESRFAREVREKLPGTKVISFDFSFERASRSEMGQAKNSKKVEKEPDLERVSGLFTALPFKDGSFDVVISSAGMPLYLNTPEQIKKAFEEVIRVLRKNGKAYLGPVTYTDIVDTDPKKTIWDTHRKHPYEESKKIFEGILNEFKEQIDFEFTPQETEKHLNRYFAEIEERMVRPAALIVSKK